MKVAVHIPFYHDENRLCYLRRIVEGLAAIPDHAISVFVYSNQAFEIEAMASSVSVNTIGVPFARLPFMHEALCRIMPCGVRRRFDPLFLTWACRDHIESMASEYDVHLYLEDDIGFTRDTFAYWLEYKDRCLANGYNLGFLRYEVRGDRTYCTDLTKKPRHVVHIGGRPFMLNDKHAYCGMWIYDRSELAQFMKSREWRFKFTNYDIRERSAIGWHGLGMGHYKGSVVPLGHQGGSTMAVDPRCGVHHFPNTYIGHPAFCSVEFPVRFRTHA